MLLKCENRKCGSMAEHLLDLTLGSAIDGGTVVCIDCGESIAFPKATKSILKSMGQIKRQAKSSLQFLCKECGNNDRPTIKILSGGAKVAICKKCEKQLNIPASFIQALEVIKVDVIDDEKDERPVIKTKTTSAKAKSGGKTDNGSKNK